MKSRIASLVLALLAASHGVAAAAEEKPRPVRMTYALQFSDGHTEGGWVHALHEGTKYEITFSDDSSHRAVEALGALDSEIVRLNTRPEHNIYLVGELKPLPGEAGKSPKATMRLDGWYLRAPFYTPPVTDPEGPIGVATELKPVHFLPAGEGPNAPATLRIRALVRIHHDKQLNLFWIEAGSPMTPFLSKPDSDADSPAPK